NRAAAKRRPEHRFFRCGGTRCRFARDTDIRARQLNRERRAVPFTRACGPGLAAVKLDDVLHDREAEAQSAIRPRDRGISLTKTIEDKRQDVSTNADAGIS